MLHDLCLSVPNVPNVARSFVVSSPSSMSHEPDQRHRYASKVDHQISHRLSKSSTTLAPKRFVRATGLHMSSIALRLRWGVIRERDSSIPTRAAHALVTTSFLHPRASSVPALVSLAFRLGVPQSALVVFVMRIASGAAAD